MAPDIVSPASHPEHVTRILRRHRQFMIVSAIAFAGLFAEEAWAASQLWSGPSPGLQLLIGALVTVFVLVGNALAFLLPIGRVRPDRFPRPVGAFATAMMQGLTIAILANAVAYLLLWSLAGFNLEAGYNLLKDVYFYTLVVVLFHGLVYYVRHMHWLYDEFGSADSPFKPIAASGGLGLIIFLVIVVFLPMDLSGISAASTSMRGLVGFHIYGRDLYLITLALGAYAWHLRWIADH